jgi:hypothetical protein
MAALNVNPTGSGTNKGFLPPCPGKPRNGESMITAVTEGRGHLMCTSTCLTM